MILKNVSLRFANEFVSTHHRHHPPVVGHKFSIGAYTDECVGVAIVGRPVARELDDGETLEVTRLCTNGYKNACSFLYGAAARATEALGYASIGTYILEEENGTSLKASGWQWVRLTQGGLWDCPSRTRDDSNRPTGKKQYYYKKFREAA